jgi:predicted GNAT family acetyltransferase
MEAESLSRHFKWTTAFSGESGAASELVAAAGAQVVSHREGVAAIGNIFTHPEFRGQGLAQIVTSAVVAALQAAGIATIGLNVKDGNAAAAKAYERVGFRTCFRYPPGGSARSHGRTATSAPWDRPTAAPLSTRSPSPMPPM